MYTTTQNLEQRLPNLYYSKFHKLSKNMCTDFYLAPFPPRLTSEASLGTADLGDTAVY